jgi:hypothetical protein
VEWAKEVADRLERVNQALTQENNRLKTQFSSQEEDRHFLIQQLVSVKKDNERLRLEYNAIELELKRLIDQNKYEASLHSRMGTQPDESSKKHTQTKPGERTAPSGAAKDADERYKEVCSTVLLPCALFYCLFHVSHSHPGLSFSLGQHTSAPLACGGKEGTHCYPQQLRG